MRALVTGGAGFIGSQLCKSLIGMDQNVTVLDNLSSGEASNVSGLGRRLTLLRGDCKKASDVRKALSGVRTVYHLAANPEVRLDHTNPVSCFNENLISTHTLLEEMKYSDAETIVFTSSSTVYGEAKIIPTPENCGGLEPISVYGASKLASEAFISAYCHSFDKRGVIVRLANIIGPKNGHGVVRDLLAQIRSRPRRLKILGDGHQSKSYLHIDDCISGIIRAVKAARGKTTIFNVGSEDQIEVRRIASIVAEEAGIDSPSFEFGAHVDGGRGWKGDVLNMLLDVSKLKSKGWKASHTSEQAVRLTVRSALNSMPKTAPSLGSAR